MKEERHSSLATFLVIYLVLVALVAVAVLFVWLSRRDLDLRYEGPAAGEGIPAEASTMPEASEKSEADAAAEAERKARELAAWKKLQEERVQREAARAKEEEMKAAAAAEAEKKPEKEVAVVGEVEALYPIPKILSLLEIVGNWESVPKRAYPKLVTLKIPVDFEVMRDGNVAARGSMPAGSSMIPLRLAGGQLTLATSPTLPIEVVVPVENTDFKERIEERYGDYVERRTATVYAQRAAELNRRLVAMANETALGQWNEGNDARFDLLKASLRRGEAATFELDFATQWRWLGEEEVEGVTYETALVAFETESAFGVARTEIKALIRDGTVERWVNATNGEPL